MNPRPRILQRFPAASWLWAGYPGGDLTNSWVQGRRVIHLADTPSSAWVHVTADTRYRLHVNGVRVLDGPARGFQDHWFFDSVDIAPHLRAGENVIAVLAHNLGIGTHSYVHQGFDEPWTSTWTVAKVGDGLARMWCFDMGREVMATTLLEIEGAAGGEAFDVLMTEGCEGAAPIFRPDVGCEMQFAHRYTCRAGGQVHESYQGWGYRYLVVVARGVRRAGVRFRVHARHVEYPLALRGRFHSSSDTLTRVYAMCAHTQLLCMSDTYVDCPSREQAMWWGDAHCHFDNSQRLGADDRLFVRGLRLMARQTLPNGLTYSHAPTKAHECVLPDFTLMWIETHWQHWWFSGSTGLFEEHCEKILHALGYFEEMASEGGLLPVDPRYWLFLDWAEVFKEGYPTLYNLQYLRTLRLAAKMLEGIGHGAATRVAAQAEALRDRIASKLWDAENELPLDGLNWDGSPVPARTLHARVMAIRAGLWPEHHACWIERDLLPFVAGRRPRGEALYMESEAQSGLDRGALTPYFMQFLFDVLAHAGQGAAVLDCIERWWGDMLSRGSATTEEAWDAVAGVGSLCHAWTAHPIQFLSSLELGIRQTAAGWRAIEFAPVFREDAAEGAVDSPLGPIAARWSRADGQIQAGVELPAGCSCTLKIPGLPERIITGAWSGLVPEDATGAKTSSMPHQQPTLAS